MVRSRSPFVALALSVLLACSEAAPPASANPEPDGTTMREPTEPVDGGAGSKTTPENPDEAAVPEVSAVTPKRATVGSVGPSIVVTGNNFVPRSIVQLDGAPLATSFVSGTELRATIPSNELSAVGSLRISVGTAPPGGGASKEINFTVENPEARLISLSPLSVVAGAGATQLEVSGSSFVTDAKIVFGTTELATTFTSSTKLKATIPTALLATSGSVPVTVVNPAPGGGASPPISFTVSNPSASIQAINPAAAFVGSAAFEMAVTGAGFVSSSKILFNGTALPTTFEGATKLRAQVPASSIDTAGEFPVAVQNVPPGGGVSAPLVFRVQYPAPSLKTVNPNSVGAGTGPTTVSVTGIGFFPASQITFDNAPAATTYVDATHMTATLSAAQLASAGSISVRIINPAPGGGSSTALPFTIMNGAPTITSLNPSSIVAASADTVVAVYGSGFIAGSTVQSNGQALPTTYVSGSQLSAAIPANQMLYPGKVAVSVVNPPPGGGTSSTSYLTIGCDTSNVTLSLTAVGTTRSLTTNFDSNVGLLSRWSSAGVCQDVPLDENVKQPARYAVIQNATGVPVTLSAWADCTNDGKGDAFLTFYRRPTIPTHDSERLGCAFVVSEGVAGVGGYASPQSGGSDFCPGLTKANGGGLQLGVCEKAVLHIQAFSTTSSYYTPPPIVRVRPE